MARTGAAGVRYPAGSAWLDALGAALALLTAGAALVVWAMARPDLPPAWWLALLAVASGALWVGWGLRRRLQGELAWVPVVDGGDGLGGTWRWISTARPRGVALTRLRVALDLGDALLLEGRTPDGLRLWLWCRRSAAAGSIADWIALRRALTAAADPEGRSGIFERAAPTP
ncbi:MAG: hypothetical protein ACUVVU_02415 [Tepidimonas sp.]|uniref:hypothetical protein n=1 Tax=Tepidimonas sp. TaxID=2002775 RepID=UPI004054C079